MLKNIKKTLKVIVKQLAIAFFFASLFYIITYFIAHRDIEFTISMINLMSVDVKERTNDPLIYDSEAKRLKVYPAYREKWANIIIEDIGIKISVYHGDTLDILKKGAGHYSGSYFPKEGGTIIIDAHSRKEFFGNLYKLKEGSKIVIEATYGTFTYEVTKGEIVKAKDLENYPITDEEEELVLYTCYPTEGIGYRTKRYVIHAKLVGEEYE